MADELIIQNWNRKARDAGISLQDVQSSNHDEMEKVCDELGISKIPELLQFKDYVDNLNNLRSDSKHRDIDITSKKKPKICIELAFSGIEKKRLPMGTLAKQFGGLLDRRSTKEQLYKGLVKLAVVVGSANLDKKNVPIIGLCGGSETGKTEFLRWIFNNCCTYIDRNVIPSADIDMHMDNDNTNTANDLIAKINSAIPQGQEKLNNMLVLFASFNQTSTYQRDEGPIICTTVERLLRSFQGNLVQNNNTAWKHQRFSGFSCLQSIIDHFDNDKNDPKANGNTGYIFCIDELSNLKNKDADEYAVLMDNILEFSQTMLQSGRFCAIVGSALSILDIGEVVIQASARCIFPVHFPVKSPEMVEKASALVHEKTDLSNAAESSRDIEDFFLRVTLSKLESSGRLMDWTHIMDLSPTSTRVHLPSSYTTSSVFSYDEIFLMVAQRIFKRGPYGPFDRKKLHELVDNLGGTVDIRPTSDGIMRNIAQQKGRMTLPAWRLLELPTKKVFKWVEHWVLVEIRKLFYEYGPAESQKMWELATMGVLELRRAMLLACSEAEEGYEEGYDTVMIPTLSEVVQGLDIHHNVDEDIMEAVASQVAARNKYTDDLSNEAKTPSDTDAPCFFYSAIENEKGIEGVFKGGYDNARNAEICVFFQMKMYKVATPGEIATWLAKIDERAKQLGFETGSYIIQLFVTGAIEENIKGCKNDWPQNSMVFGTEALTKLFEPFGRGIIEELIKLKDRRKQNKVIL